MSGSTYPFSRADSVLRACQESGIPAWDCAYKEQVLVLPSVLTLTDDNPMQSEFACHIGFRGKFFCRVCHISGHGEAEEGEDTERDNASMHSCDSCDSGDSQGTPRQGKQVKETMDELINQVINFIKVRMFPK